jgi:hypothetical protein
VSRGGPGGEGGAGAGAAERMTGRRRGGRLATGQGAADRAALAAERKRAAGPLAAAPAWRVQQQSCMGAAPAAQAPPRTAAQPAAPELSTPPPDPLPSPPPPRNENGKAFEELVIDRAIAGGNFAPEGTPRPRELCVRLPSVAVGAPHTLGPCARPAARRQRPRARPHPGPAGERAWREKSDIDVHQGIYRDADTQAILSMR